jgi:hypothetical protein
VAVVVALATGALRDDGAGRYPIEAELEPEALQRSEMAAAAFSLARAVLTASDDAIFSVDGPSVPTTLCAYRVHGAPRCSYGEGASLTDAVRAAAEGLARDLPAGAVPLLAIDFETDRRDVTVGQPGHRPRDPGLWGWRWHHEQGVAVLPPAAVLALDVFGGDDEDDKRFRPERLRDELLRRAPAELPPPDEQTALVTYRSVSWVETDHGPLRTYRLHAHERAELGVDHLAQRAAWAAEHLASTVEADGKVRYLFDVSKGRELRGYNLLRHGGTTYSLLQAYQRFGHEPWLRAAEAAIGYLLRKSKRDVRHGPYGGGETLWVDESSYVKLGGAGLALVMLSQHMVATGERTHLDDARAYARFLVSQQQQDGEFVYFAPRTPGGEARDRTSAYYPGEAILGLTKLYAIDPDPLWLQTAQRGADWLIDVRDEGKGPADLANDHWLMIALSHLVKHTGDPRYVEHSHKLAAAVAHQAERNARKVSTHADYYGSYYDPPRSTPAATRGEGLVAVLDTCELTERPCDEVLGLLQATVTHELWSQYTPDTVWWMPTPAEALGGFSGGIMDPDLRNDFTQHNLSSVLGTERHLRRALGQTVPGGPRWTAADQAGYDGAAAVDVPALLAPFRRLRGPHRWDAEPEESP